MSSNPLHGVLGPNENIRVCLPCRHNRHKDCMSKKCSCRVCRQIPLPIFGAPVA